MTQQMPILQIPSAALRVLSALEADGHQAFVVGGCVRDALLGLVPNDWDICTSAKPEQTKVAVACAGLHSIDTGIKHGTVTVLVDHEPFEVTTFRSDGSYSDGRHPDKVEFLDSIQGDLLRRDFTINAMAYHPNQGLIDITGGQQDLEQGILRCVGDPLTRFTEDGLRIMRALRFASAYGLAIEDETARVLREHTNLLDTVAMERVAHELKRLVCGKAAANILLEFAQVFARRLPEIEPMVGFEQHSRYHVYDVWEHCVRAMEYAPADDAAIRLALLFHDVGKPETFFTDEQGEGHFYGHPQAGEPLARKLCNRLKLSNDETHRICELVLYHDRKFGLTRKSMRRLILKLGEQRVRELFVVRECDIRAHAPEHVAKSLEHQQELVEFFEETLASMQVFSLRDMELKGSDVIALGVEPGPAVGKVLQAVFERVVEGELPNERETLVQYASSFLNSAKNTNS